ncbi:MAG: molybdopterin molybdotransferase MoeA, partial [Thermoplasmata archaeon]
MKMRPLKKLISYKEAKEIIDENIRGIESVENVPILHAAGRVIAEDILAKINVPSFDRASMDGFAVIAEDTFSATQTKPCALKVIGEIYAGEKKVLAIRKGEAVKIATGARMPKGADSVVIFEETDIENDTLRVYKPVHPGANVSKMGSDIKSGDLVVPKDKILDASKIGAIASLGYKEVTVYRKPIVSIIPTGNEIAEVGEPLNEGQVYNTNTYTIASVVNENGGIPSP